MFSADAAPPRDLAAALARVHAALEAADIWHCLAFGTLLGAVRDGTTVPWDHDIDLLARPADVARILAISDGEDAHGVRFTATLLDSARLALNPGGVTLFDPGFLFVYVDGDCYGEVFLPSLFSDGVLRLFDFERDVAYWPEASFPHHFVGDLATGTVDGTHYPIPRDAEGLLMGWYGEDWTTPYRSTLDGGDEVEGRTRHGTVAGSSLATMVAWCTARGWDRSSYSEQPAWPRRLQAAGPPDRSVRSTRDTSRSAWWHTLDDVLAHC